MRWLINSVGIKVVGVLFISLSVNFVGYGQNCEEKYIQMNELYKEGKIKEVIAVGEVALTSCEKELGLYSKYYADVIFFMAIVYREAENLKKAEEFYNTFLSIGKQVELGSEYYLTALTSLGILYTKTNDLEKAESIFIESISVQKKISEKVDSNYIKLLETLGTVYFNQGKYSIADSCYLEVLSAKKSVFGNNHIEYILTLNRMGNIYLHQLNYSKAEKFFLEAIEKSQKVLGISHADYANILNNVAALYSEMGNYSKSESFYLKSLSTQEKISGTETEGYSSTLTNLASMYTKEGEYANAEQLYFKASKIIKRIIGTESSDYAYILNNWGSLYDNLGNFSKAETFYLEALRIRQNILGSEHPDYAITLNNLAVLYDNINDFEKAEILYLKALEITEKIFGTTHPDYASKLGNLGTLYFGQGLYSKAETKYKEAIAINPNNLVLLGNLGLLYLIQKQYLKSETLFLKTFSIVKEQYGKGNLNYIGVIDNLANLYSDLRKPELFPYLSELLPLNQKQIIQQTSFQTTNELSAYLKANTFNYFDGKFSLVYPFKITNDTINYELYNTAILLKNLTLRNSTQVQNRIRKNKDSVLINALEEFQEIKKQLNRYANLPKAEQPAGIKELENKADLLEKKLVTGSQAFKEAKEFTNTTWKNVQQSLKKEEAAVEFVSFQYLNQKWTDSIIYAVMVIMPGYHYPKIIPLFEQKQLDSLLKINSSLPEENYLNGLYNKDNFGLYNLIIKPIDSLLKGVTTIYTAPSGSLYNINLSQVISHKPDGSTFNVHILGTTGELPRYTALQLNKTTTSNAVIFGGVNYDTASNSGISFQPPVYTPGFEQVASVTNRGGINSWSYLSGTLTEAMQVEKINTKAGLKVTILKDDVANETSFKNLNGFASPYILHLATHGYFFPNPIQEKPRDFDLMNTDKKTVYKWTEDPLLRSGLILAGANKAWKNSALITDSTEDGILTSMEVANVDLSNCKLAVLSACETGLGDINGSEGVFGLQRGFKLAGVKNIIMSLWKIPDIQSAELLTLFYENCFSGLSVHESLKQAQLAMSKKYPAYYWAGFVLLE